MVSFGIALLVTILIGSCWANYCDPSLCRRGPHIACNGPPGFGHACGRERQFIEMGARMQRVILKKHNELRAEIANGMHGFPPAARMPTLVWDAELAHIASFNARKCIFAHDRCRNTRAFKYAGQNLAIIKFSGFDFQAEDRAVNFTQEWFNEYKDCPKHYVDSYPANHRGPQIGHFTQIVNDRAWKVGCSMVEYKSGRMTAFYLVCNYSMTNMIDEPVYTTGRTGSGCKTGPNPRIRGLCSPRERIASEPSWN